MAGRICGPTSLPPLTPVSKISAAPQTVRPPVISYKENTDTATAAPSSTADVVAGFPSTLRGEFIFCDADNLNTDGIYPGKYTYVDDIPPEKMAQVVMENYDANFSKTVQKVDGI